MTNTHRNYEAELAAAEQHVRVLQELLATAGISESSIAEVAEVFRNSPPVTDAAVEQLASAVAASGRADSAEQKLEIIEDLLARYKKLGQKLICEREKKIDALQSRATAAEQKLKEVEQEAQRWYDEARRKEGDANRYQNQIAALAAATAEGGLGETRERMKQLELSLHGLLGLEGKDTSNPKFKGYFDNARQLLNLK